MRREGEGIDKLSTISTSIYVPIHLSLISEVGKANGLNMLLDAETFDYTYHLKAGQGRHDLCCSIILRIYLAR